MHKHFMDRHKPLMVEGWHAMCVKWGRIGANEQSDGEHRLNRGPRHPSAYPQLAFTIGGHPEAESDGGPTAWWWDHEVL